jgi:hypothetical protein
MRGGRHLSRFSPPSIFPEGNDSSPSSAMVQPNGPGDFEQLARQGPRVKVGLLRASFARNYEAKGGLAKSADAQRQAFTRALRAALAERMVNQDS